MAVVVLVSAFFGMNALAATEELLNLCPVSRYIDPIQDNTLPYPQFYFPEHQVLATVHVPLMSQRKHRQQLNCVCPAFVL
jgi:hypothetical protein